MEHFDVYDEYHLAPADTADVNERWLRRENAEFDDDGDADDDERDALEYAWCRWLQEDR